MNKLVYLGLSILDMSKIVMYDYYWYDYVRPKYGKKAKLCYTDTDSFIVHAQSEDIYVDLAWGVRKRFDTSNYEVKRPVPMRKNKMISLMRDERVEE